MPRAFDRRTPELDKDPNRSATDWNDPWGAVGDTAKSAGEGIRGGLLKWMTGEMVKPGAGGLADKFQEFLDKLGGAFGSPGTGTPMADIIAAIQKWKDGSDARQDARQAAWQEWIDGLKDGFTIDPSSTTPIKDIIQGIFGIKNTADAARDSAEFANIGVAAIRAEQAGGAFDEFDYANADTLPAADYTPFYTGAGSGTYGPDGNGKLVYKGKGIGARGVWYRRDTKPVTRPTGSVTVVLSKAPSLSQKDCYLYICAQWSATDQSRIQVRISQSIPLLALNAKNSAVQFQTVNSGGGASDIGGENSNVPKLEAGDVLELSWDATTLTLKRNGINAHSVPYTPLTGQCTGFGSSIPIFIGFNHPGAEFAGVAWH